MMRRATRGEANGARCGSRFASGTGRRSRAGRSEAGVKFQSLGFVAKRQLAQQRLLDFNHQSAFRG
jgi:hypothetical protein